MKASCDFGSFFPLFIKPLTTFLKVPLLWSCNNFSFIVGNLFFLLCQNMEPWLIIFIVIFQTYLFNHMRCAFVPFMQLLVTNTIIKLNYNYMINSQFEKSLNNLGKHMWQNWLSGKISLCSSQFGEDESRCLWVLASVHSLRKWVVKNWSHGCPVWGWNQEEAMS